MGSQQPLLLKLNTEEIIPQKCQTTEEITRKETTQTNSRSIDPRNEIIEEEKATDAGSSSSFVTSESTTSSNEEESDVTIEMPNFCESEFKTGINITYETTTLLNVSKSSLIFKEKAEEIVKEGPLQIAPEKSLEESSVMGQKKADMEKETSLTVVLNLNPADKGSISTISHPLTQNTEPSPRGKIYFGKRYLKHRPTGEVNNILLHKSANHTDFESSESVIEKAEYIHSNTQNNTFELHNRKPDIIVSKNTDIVIDIPGYEEGLKENSNQNINQNERASKHSGLVPLLGMLGFGSFLYYLASNQST